MVADNADNSVPLWGCLQGRLRVVPGFGAWWGCVWAKSAPAHVPVLVGGGIVGMIERVFQAFGDKVFAGDIEVVACSP